MASLRDLARRTVSRALGVNADPPAPPSVRFDRVAPAVARAHADRGAARAIHAPAVDAPAVEHAHAAHAHAEHAHTEHAPIDAPDAALAEALATIACGAQELRERIGAGEPVTVVDVREPFEALSGTLPHALRIPLAELGSRWKELESIDEIVCYCADGARSLEAATLLRQNGLFNATSLEGGIAAWIDVGGAVVRPESA